MKKIAFLNNKNGLYININDVNHYIGKYEDGPVINIDELLEILHENGIVEYKGMFHEWIELDKNGR